MSPSVTTALSALFLLSGATKERELAKLPRSEVDITLDVKCAI
jgi:hypothetical protein